MQKRKDNLEPLIEGRIALHELVDGTLKGRKRLVADQQNLITDLAFDELMPRILGRDPDKDLAIISIGEGGDYTQNGVPTGQRQAPAVTDEEMRVELFRAPIVQINFPAANEVEFVGLMREREAVSSDIDEFGLLSVDGSMFSHSINPESAGAGSPTVKYTKPLGAIFTATWTLTITRCP